MSVLVPDDQLDLLRAAPEPNPTPAPRPQLGQSFDQPDAMPAAAGWQPQTGMNAPAAQPFDYFNRQQVTSAPTGAWGDNAPAAGGFETLGRIGSGIAGFLGGDVPEALRPDSGATFPQQMAGSREVIEGAIMNANLPRGARSTYGMAADLEGAIAPARLPQSQFGRTAESDALFTAGPNGERVGPTGNVREMRLGREPARFEDQNRGLRSTNYGRAEQANLAAEEQAAFRDAGDRAMAGADQPIGGGAPQWDQPYYHGSRSADVPMSDLETGRPTRNQMEVFGETRAYDNNRHAVFMTDTPEFAQQFGDTMLSGNLPKGRTLRLAESPYNSDSFRNNVWGDFGDWLGNKWRAGAGNDYRETSITVNYNHPPEQAWKLFDGDLGQKFTEYLREKGYQYAEFKESVPTQADTSKTVRGTTVAAFGEQKPFASVRGGADVPAGQVPLTPDEFSALAAKRARGERLTPEEDARVMEAAGRALGATPAAEQGAAREAFYRDPANLGGGAEPAVPQGHTRLYRVEPNEFKGMPDEVAWRKALGEEFYQKSVNERGRLFSEVPLEQYGHGENTHSTYYVDVPNDVAQQMRRANPAGVPQYEYLLPREVADAKQPLRSGLTPEQQANVSGTVQRAGQLNTIKGALSEARAGEQQVLSAGDIASRGRTYTDAIEMGAAARTPAQRDFHLNEAVQMEQVLGPADARQALAAARENLAQSIMDAPAGDPRIARWRQVDELLARRESALNLPANTITDSLANARAGEAVPQNRMDLAVTAARSSADTGMGRGYSRSVRQNPMPRLTADDQPLPRDIAWARYNIQRAAQGLEPVLEVPPVGYVSPENAAMRQAIIDRGEFGPAPTSALDKTVSRYENSAEGALPEPTRTVPDADRLAQIRANAQRIARGEQPIGGGSGTSRLDALEAKLRSEGMTPANRAEAMDFLAREAGGNQGAVRAVNNWTDLRPQVNRLQAEGAGTSLRAPERFSGEQAMQDAMERNQRQYDSLVQRAQREAAAGNQGAADSFMRSADVIARDLGETQQAIDGLAARAQAGFPTSTAGAIEGDRIGSGASPVESDIGASAPGPTRDAPYTIDLRRGFAPAGTPAETMLEALGADAGPISAGGTRAALTPGREGFTPRGTNAQSVVHLDSLQLEAGGEPAQTLALMRRIAEEADRNGVTVTLDAVPYETLATARPDTGRLQAFYRRYGFVDSGDGSMVRAPRPAAADPFARFDRPVDARAGALGDANPSVIPADRLAQIRANAQRIARGEQPIGGGADLPGSQPPMVPTSRVTNLPTGRSVTPQQVTTGDVSRNLARTAVAPLEKPSLLNQVTDVANLPRTVLTSFDLSAPFRQGAMMIGHPKEFFGAMKPMIKALASEGVAQEVDAAIRSGPRGAIKEQAGLYLSPIDNAGGLATREEAYMSRLAGKIPGVAGSERAYATFLNKVRSDVFDHFWENLPQESQTIENAARYSHFINAATGRGSMPAALKDLAPALNAAFFSPRYFISRFESNGMGVLAIGDLAKSAVTRQALDPVSKAIAGDVLKFYATGVTAMGLAAAAGASVETDPRSSDFGKIRVGDTRYDVWAGNQQIARFIATEYKGQKKSNGSVSAYPRNTTALNFLRSKLGPMPGLVWDVLKGSTPTGDKVDSSPASLKRILWNEFVPMIAQDITSAVQTSGVAGGIKTLPTILGVGTQTYAPSSGGTSANPFSGGKQTNPFSTSSSKNPFK